MKKVLLASLFLLSGVCLAKANDRIAGLPRDQKGDPVATSDYAGVDYATANVFMSTTNILLFPNEGVVYGFLVSTGSVGVDCVVFRATGSLSLPGATNDNLLNNEAFRVYIPTISVGSVFNPYTSVVTLPKPVRFKNGVTARIQGTAIGGISYLYHAFGGN